MSKLSKSHFWEWFKRHHKEYLTINTKSKKEARYWLNELKAHLRAYFKFLEFSIQLPREQPAKLTITVSGKARHFRKVDALVAAAPSIPGWKISALEDPMPIDFLLEELIEETGIDPREFYFSFVSDDPSDTGIIVYHPLCTEDNKFSLSQLAESAMYNLLGERSFGMDVDLLEVANLSCLDMNETERLEDLGECVGMRKSSIVVDDQGRLVGMN